MPGKHSLKAHIVKVSASKFGSHRKQQQGGVVVRLGIQVDALADPLKNSPLHTPGKEHPEIFHGEIRKE